MTILWLCRRMFLLVGNIKVSRGDRAPVNNFSQMVQGKTKIFALYLKLFCTFEVTSGVKIFFLKKGKRDIRNSEYRQLSQEVTLQSRANKWGSCWRRKWGVQEKKFKFYLRWRNNSMFECCWKGWNREPKLVIQNGQWTAGVRSWWGRWDLVCSEGIYFW